MATIKTKKKESPKEGKNPSGKPSRAVIAVHVTEKATQLKDQSAYVFKIDSALNKITVKEEIKKAYGVSPKMVRIINIPGKTVFLRRRRVKTPGYKKAIVYLKKGETIKT